jgi:S1-C subfamily serine protease
MMRYRLRTLIVVGALSSVALFAVVVVIAVSSRPTYLSGPIGIVKGRGEMPQHGFMGIAVEAPDVPLIVQSVLPGSGAADAGLQPGDTILSIGSISSPDWEALQRVAQSASPGDEIPLLIQRESQDIQLTVRLMSFLEMAQLQANAMKAADLKRARKSKP